METVARSNTVCGVFRRVFARSFFGTDRGLDETAAERQILAG
jgi:hypothetical protein